MASNPVAGVLNYALTRYVRTESFRDGLQTGTRAEFHMAQEDALVVLGYILQKTGSTADQALKMFTDHRTIVLQSKAKSADEWNPMIGLLISALVGVGAGIGLSFLKGSMWLKLALLVAAILLVFTFVFLLVWYPRSRVMEEAWGSGGSLAERLEKLHKIQEMSLKEIILEY